jgi:hypothetical integral membrane protein (TIGR02206 family)
MPQPLPHPWLEDFAPFTLLHIFSVAVCAAAMLGACLIGRRTCNTIHERRFRLAWGWFALAFIVARNVYYMWPSRFDLESNLPLHACDLAVLTAALAMIWPARPLRTLLYFWGIGLSVQAFLTPTLQFGVGYPQFWIFWIWHTIIVGSAVYDLVIGGYRPTGSDCLLAICATLAYGILMALVDWQFNLNYGYVGPKAPSNPTLIDALGPWPGRVVIIFAIGTVEFLALWLVWPLARRISRAGATRLTAP